MARAHKTKVVAILHADGRREDFEPHREMDLKQMQEVVGGYIEYTRPVLPHRKLVVNEEGLLRGLPLNPEATAMYYAVGGGSPIVGHVLLVKS